MPDHAIVDTTVRSAPKDYRLTGSQELLLKAVRAAIDGSGASSSYLPALQLLAPDGTVMWTAVPLTAVAAGGSVDASWFPDVIEQAAPSANLPIGVTTEVLYYDTVDAASPLVMSTTLDAGVSYVLVCEGTYSLWNTALADGTPEADAQFPGSTVGRVSTEVGLDADTDFAKQAGSGRTLGHATLLKFSLDGGTTFQHVEPVGGPFTVPQSGHLYRYELTGQGHPLHVRLDDINPPDNYGRLRFTLQVPSGTGTGTGAGQLVPPSDATQNGDVLTVVSGVPEWEPPAGGTITELDSPNGTITVSNPTGPTTDIDLPDSGVTPGTYGDGSHVPAFTVDAEGRVTAVTPVGVTGGTGTIGFEIGYDQITASVNIASTSEAAPTTIITCAAHTFDGGPVICSFYAARLITSTGAANNSTLIGLYESGSQILRLISLRTVVVATPVAQTVFAQVRFTPSAGSHSYVVGGFASSTTGPPSVEAGAGGAGTAAPTYVRFTKV